MRVSYLILVLRLEVGLYSTNERQQRCKHEVMNRDLLYCGCLLEGKKKKKDPEQCVNVFNLQSRTLTDQLIPFIL